MVKSGLSDVTVENLMFQGDHTTERLRDVDYYLHENQTEIAAKGYFTHGIVMVGLVGGANGVRIQHCILERFSMNGFSLIGNAELRGNVIHGIVPDPDSTQFILDTIIPIKQHLSDAAGGPIGLDWQAGVSQAFNYGRVTVDKNEFSNLVEGITGSTAPSWHVAGNSFATISDHGVYLLGEIEDATIESNRFTRVFDESIKLGGNSVSPDPLTSTEGATRATIADNTFRVIHRAAILMSGTRNHVHDNTIAKYRRAEDPTPAGVYNPEFLDALGRPTRFPQFWLTTSGGQKGWWNHAAFNRFERNRFESGELTIFFEQPPDPDAKDRSIASNCVLGGGQIAYSRVRLDSSYEPIIYAGEPTSILFAGPPDCPDCYSTLPGYFTTGTVLPGSICPLS